MKKVSWLIFLSTIFLLESIHFVESDSQPGGKESAYEQASKDQTKIYGRTHKDLDGLKRTHDLNGDGKLSPNELASAVEKTLALLHAKKKARENVNSANISLVWFKRHVLEIVLFAIVTVMAAVVYLYVKKNMQESTGINVQDIRARRLAKLSAEKKLKQFQQSVSQSHIPELVKAPRAEKVEPNARGDLTIADLVSATKETDINEAIKRSSTINSSKITDSVRRRPHFTGGAKVFCRKQKDDIGVGSSSMNHNSGGKEFNYGTLMEKNELLPNESERNIIETKEKCSDNEVADVFPDLSATTQKLSSRKDYNSHGDEIEDIEAKVLTDTTNDSRKTSTNCDTTDKEHENSVDEDGKKTSKEAEMLPFGEVVKLSLESVLDCTLEISESSRQRKSGLSLKLQTISNNKTKFLFHLQSSDLPTGEDDLKKKLEKLVAKRLLREVDPMKFAILCFERCDYAAPTTVSQSRNGPGIWQVLTVILKNMCVDAILKHLAQVTTSPTTVEEDLWSDFVQSKESQAACRYFLSCLGGWSLDGVSVSSNLLTQLLEKGKSDNQAKETFLEMVVAAGRQVDGVQRLNEVMVECSNTFRGLETLLSQPIMVNWIADILEKEASQSLNDLGVFFQEKSLFSSYLKLTTLEVRVNQKSRASECFSQLPRFPRALQSDVDHVQNQIQDGFHACQNIVYRTLLKVMKTRSKESGIAWIAAVVAANEMRLSTSVDAEKFQSLVASDGFMLNFCTVALQLCEPFFKSKSNEKYMSIETDYCTSDACRFQLCNESTLPGGHIGTEESVQLSERLFPPPEKKEKFRLVTEMFHLTARALHIGLMQVIQHYNRLIRNYATMSEMKSGTAQEGEARKLLMLFVYQWETCLHEDYFVRLCSQFYVTLAAWLLGQLKYKTGDVKEQKRDDSTLQREQEIYSKIPEYYLKDMCSWFTFVAVNKPFILKGVEYCQGLMCCMTLLQRKDLVRGPVAATRVVQMMLTFAESIERTKRSQCNSLGSSNWGSGVEGDMSACVYMCPVVQKALGRALMETYICVDVVEGLDVDKEEFDKFSSRLQVVRMLNFLWRKPETQVSILTECGKQSFQEFLSAILDTLLYLLNDALSRICHVKKLQTSRQSEEAKWNESAEREEKESFLKNEERVARSFMTMAKTTLEFLEMICENNDVAKCFSRSPLSQRAASAIIGFLESLCGPKSHDLRVQNMERYAFNPRELLVKIVTILVRISKGTENENRVFVKCLSADPDYCQPTVERACRVIERQGLASDETVQDLKKIMSEVSYLIDRREENETGSKTDEEGAEAAAGGDDLVAVYSKILEPLKFEHAELLVHHALQSLVAQPTCCPQRSSKIKALMKESAWLKEHLPIHPDASIFVRQDENRMDVIRALITGPVDTPYSRGCFVFDVYFPATYPNVPPVVKLITTGNGTVRFNPNLYQDGKVCLSLLGTWHGGDATEKWDSTKSSLYQVLLSIQGMIFISDPVFNEPGYEGIRGTAEGDTLCREYNASIRLATVRHAMLGQLQHPPPGFEDVVKEHFKLQKDAILKQCSDWLHQCTDEEEDRRMRRAVDCLRSELEKL